MAGPHSRELCLAGRRRLRLALETLEGNFIDSTLYLASTWVIPALLAITLHEAAHGYVAKLRGDDTAWQLGRVSFNPLKHVDSVGTIALPALLLLMHAPFLFGYAKPVPVRFDRLRNPRRDMVSVAAAGPAMNLALAILAALLVHVVALVDGGIELRDFGGAARFSV